MPRQLAALICLSLIFYLFWMDRKENEGVSKAIWIPFIWMFFTGSRELSLWLNLRTPGDITDGQPYDRAFYTVLIAVAFIILRRRKINWNELFTKNVWIWLYFIFGVLSFLWSDYPFVSFKRWIKGVGLVFMATVILTEERPYDALGVILRRLAFLFLPLSVLFIKYYPELGKQYHNFTGVAMYIGVATQKNGLGRICLLSTIYFSWNLLFNRQDGIELGRKLHFSIYLILFPMIAWLLYMANSATSLTCMVVAVAIFIVARQPAIARKPIRIMTICLGCIIIYGILDFLFDVNKTVIAMLGRRPDLTTRVPMWKELLNMVKNPIVGFGYESFWLGARRQIMELHWGIGMQAHNGYLDMYLNLGLIGLFFVVCWILLGLRKVSRQLVIDYRAGILRLCFIIIVALYNWTEATFYGLNIMWMLLFLGIMDVPSRQESLNTLDNVEENI
jgi:exopolysaccharide production protein ExoQ